MPGSNDGDRGHPLEPLLLTQVDPRARGRAHGEHWRQAIGELAELRLGLTLRRSRFASAAELLAAAGLHLPELRRRLPHLADELEGIAEGADLPPERVVMLNQYRGWNRDRACDLRGLPRSVLEDEPGALVPAAALERTAPRHDADPGGGTVVYFHGVRGPLLGQTWDVHADAEPYVRMLRIAPEDGERETLCLTLAGCLGIAGINERGVAATMSDLHSTDGRVGVVWTALLRALLEQPHARGAYELLRRTPPGSGHHVVLADGHDYYGVECSGQLQVLTQLGPKAAHLHTNHCFDPVLRQREAVPRSSRTFHRLNLATTVYAQQRPRDADGMWSLLHTRDGSPGSLIIDPPGPTAEPSVTATCAVIVMRLHDGWIRVVRGAGHRGQPLELRVGRFEGQPEPSA